MVGRDTFEPFLDTFLLVAAVGATWSVGSGGGGVVISAFTLTIGTAGTDAFVLSETFTTTWRLSHRLIDLLMGFFFGDFR